MLIPGFIPQRISGGFTEKKGVYPGQESVKKPFYQSERFKKAAFISGVALAILATFGILVATFPYAVAAIVGPIQWVTK